jgi:hypothetical protein
VRFENKGLISKAFDPRKAREVLEAAGVAFVGEIGDAGVRLLSDEAAVPEMPEGVAKDYDGSPL